MIIRSISIRSKLQLTTLVIALIMIILALVYMDATREMDNNEELLKARSVFQSEYFSLANSIQKLLLDHEDNLIATSIRQAHQLEEELRAMLNYNALSGSEQLDRKVDRIVSSLDRLEQHILAPENVDSTSLIETRTEMDILGELAAGLDLSISDRINSSKRKNNLQLGLSLVIAVLSVAAYLLLFTQNINGAFQKLTEYTQLLKKGKIPPPLQYHSDDEFNQIATNLNSHSGDLHNKVAHIASLSKEGPGNIIKPGEEDELGKALLDLSDVLIRKELDEVTRNREDKKKNWISEGMAQMGEILRSERDNVIELSFLIVQKLVTYMNLEMGSLYITDDSDPENLTLNLVTSYAYDRRKFLDSKLEWGVGLPGTCAQEKERIFITDVPEDYFEVTSGTGTSIPNCLLLVPLKFDNDVYGVLELATVRLLRPFEIEFVESLSESITSSLLAVRNSERTTELLKQSQAQAEALTNQEAAMRENMEQLELTQKESGKKEVEINGILNAINQSSLVAEMGLNGRFSSINDKFLMLLESSKDQVIGKMHSEFAQVDPYADEYKAFWSSLREGSSISKTEMYKLYSGKEVWLEQTFTPIINNEGKVYKILNIGVDITENRTLQERVKTRELEITRSGMDMKTLNEAVNKALIKCELDAEGIIIDVNENYTDLTGYGRKELLGRNYRLFLKDTEKEQFERIWNEVVKEKVYEGVIRRSKPTGEEVWLVSTFSPVKDETGVIYKVYFMGLDITEKKLKYQLLEDANQKIDRLKDRLKNYED